MLTIFNLLDYMVSAERNQRLIARIVLNVLGFQERFPVDVSELRQLSAKNHALVSSFLHWAAFHPDYFKGDLTKWSELIAYAEGRVYRMDIDVEGYMTSAFGGRMASWEIPTAAPTPVATFSPPAEG